MSEIENILNFRFSIAIQRNSDVSVCISCQIEVFPTDFNFCGCSIINVIALKENTIRSCGRCFLNVQKLLINELIYFFKSNNKNIRTITIKLSFNQLTNKIQPSPFETFNTDGNLETNVALYHQRWLHTNCPISIDDMANHFFRIENAHNTFIGIETRARYIDNRSAQHISRFGCKY